MKNGLFRCAGGIGRLLFFLGLVGCESGVKDRQEMPLRPLAYTETPDLTPEAVAIREARLLRSLAAGAAQGRWGDLEVRLEERDPLNTPDAFGHAFLNALTSRSRGAWEHIFVHPDEYAQMVHVTPEHARVWVDELIAKSESIWRRFEPPSPSEARPNGWADVFAFEGIHLGEGRAVDGKITADPLLVAQHWNAILKLKFLPRQTSVDVRLPKILVIRQDDRVTYRLAAAPEVDIMLSTLLEAGMHLRSELLRAEEYPYPLKVGAFWRYRREIAEQPESTVLQEVVSVDHLNGIHIVRLRETVQSAEILRNETYWALTPLRIYPCDAGCRRNAEDTHWMLRYFSFTPPEFVFPLVPGVWASRSDKVTVSQGEEVNTPAGMFPSVLQINRPRACLTIESFVVQKGVVRRERRCASHTETDTLVDYRLLPN